MQPIQTVIYKKAKMLRLSRSWWGHIWVGLVTEHTAKHNKLMGKAIWLYLYFIVHANRKTGILFRQTKTITKDMGIPIRTIQQWLSILRKHKYVTTEFTGRSLIISITKWRPIIKTR